MRSTRAIVVRLMGGLGNQMFQYALGRGISEEAGTEVSFDVESGFRNDGYGRRFALSVFNGKIVRAESREIPVGMSWRSPWHRVAKAGWSAIPGAWRRVVYERAPFRFDAAVTAKVVPAAYFFGYWQNEGYFLPIQDLLRREFTLRVPASDSVAALARQISGCRSVSMHVRCEHGIGAAGKPIGNTREYHGSCGIEYFQDALDAIGVESGTVCYVFSDNPAWTKANLRLPVSCIYVSEICACSDAEEMLLMASCQHHIISNSTFSWWGAWLGRNPKKAVVAPRIWMRGLPEAAVDICPRTWLRL